MGSESAKDQQENGQPRKADSTQCAAETISKNEVAMSEEQPDLNVKPPVYLTCMASEPLDSQLVDDLLNDKGCKAD
jgi:hypothetical protein